MPLQGSSDSTATTVVGVLPKAVLVSCLSAESFGTVFNELSLERVKARAKRQLKIEEAERAGS